MFKKTPSCITIHTSKQHVAKPNHAPPSISLHPSILDSVIICHLKTMEFEDVVTHTSPVIPHPKNKKAHSSARGHLISKTHIQLKPTPHTQKKKKKKTSKKPKDEMKAKPKGNLT